MQTSPINGPLWGHRARDWAEVQEGIIAPAYRAVLDHAGAGADTEHLDIGCGSGMAARLSADRGARVSGVDASEALLAIARERTPEGDFRQADLEALPFDDAKFGLVTSFNAVQFAGDPVVALAEARRVLRPDGLIAVTVWGEPDDMPMAAVITALGRLMPPPPPGTPGPFAQSSAGALQALVRAAGLTPGKIIDVIEPVIYPDRATALRGLNSSGVAARAIAAVGEDAVTGAHAAALAPLEQADGSYRIGATFRCLFARAAR